MSDDTAPPPEILERAARAYRAHQKDWSYLGYPQEIAIAVLADFFSIKGKLKNRSEKPLNVVKMVGRLRIQAITDAIKSRPAPAAAEPDPPAPPADEAQPDVDVE